MDTSAASRCSGLVTACADSTPTQARSSAPQPQCFSSLRFGGHPSSSLWFPFFYFWLTSVASRALDRDHISPDLHLTVCRTFFPSSFCTFPSFAPELALSLCYLPFFYSAIGHRTTPLLPLAPPLITYLYLIPLAWIQPVRQS